MTTIYVSFGAKTEQCKSLYGGLLNSSERNPELCDHCQFKSDSTHSCDDCQLSFSRQRNTQKDSSPFGKKCEQYFQRTGRKRPNSNKATVLSFLKKIISLQMSVAHQICIE